MNLSALCEAIKTEAQRLGFTHSGIAPALPVPHLQTFLEWVEKGCHADMGYLEREDTLAKRKDPRLILEDCQRIICLALPYQPPEAELGDRPPGKGRVSAYAVTRDYHQIIWEKLSQLETFIRAEAGENVRLKSYVDTGPILERSYASLAGIGTIGKNACLIIQGSGSYFFLAEILTDLRLPVDAPFTRDLCGACRRCIEACPTGCILPDRTIDAGRCISYLTIENKGEIPDDLKPKIGDWVFGCDLCQMVCPHNARAQEGTTSNGELLPPEFIDLASLFSFDEGAFRKRFGPTPLSRTKRNGLLRNAAVVLGNQHHTNALPVLEKALEKETDPKVLNACHWAITQMIKEC